MHVTGTMHRSCCFGKGYMLFLESWATDLFSCLGISICCFNHRSIKHSNVTAERDADRNIFPFPQISGTYSNYLDDISPQRSVAQSWGGGSLIISKALLSPAFNAVSVSGRVVVINEQQGRRLASKLNWWTVGREMLRIGRVVPQPFDITVVINGSSNDWMLSACYKVSQVRKCTLFCRISSKCSVELDWRVLHQSSVLPTIKQGVPLCSASPVGIICVSEQ